MAKETWIVQVNNSILGPVVPQARRQGHRFVPAAKLPQHLRAYLNLPERRTVRPVMQDFTRVEDLDALGLDENLVRRTQRRGARLLTIVIDGPQRPASRPAPRPKLTVRKHGPLIRNFQGLLNYFAADRPALLNKRIYKGTDCGASISIELADGTWVHNGDSRWETLTGKERIRAFTIQTIVEGSEATVDSEPFLVPCTQKEVEAWIAEMEAEADRLWQEANAGENEG